ncbi:hypothetical protein Salat_0028100 [Sesamum alatum]|uniref:Bifunctional inhibitor/plant lipid transfer protein/seed storage helical domain-containing protein n=1 Tax=Sesamum alatum TaxID=300844 RepID=A0AAE1YVK4_9LAMI|nr:hypothetical protein Salat_0028100 [Sesamum alatum]
MCCPISLLPLLLLSWISADAVAQSSVAECGPSLLPLAPCAPFVQGTAATPVQSCCDSLNQLYNQNPTCICLLLHDTSLASSFPINATLAHQLPLLCNLNIDTSTCAGISLPSLSPPTQVSFGARPNSTVAASPVVAAATPGASFVGFGFHHNGEVRVKAEAQLKKVDGFIAFYCL